MDKPTGKTHVPGVPGARGAAVAGPKMGGMASKPRPVVLKQVDQAVCPQPDGFEVGAV